jgi:hypothetical protein
MKLNIPAVLVTLFCGLSNADMPNTHVKIADVPSHVEVGQQIRLQWSTDRDVVRTLLRVSPHDSIGRNGSENLWPATDPSHTRK